MSPHPSRRRGFAPAVLRPFAALLLAFACLAAPAPLAAQSQSTGGEIEGTVRDAEGSPLPGVQVVIESPATGTSRNLLTDGDGRFRAPLLPVGTYDVSAALDGFPTARRSGVVLNIGQTLDLDFTLALATTAESIEVTGAAPLLEASRTSQSSTVTAEAVENLPTNGRNFIDFVLTTPGVTRDVRLGDISFAGQRGTLNSLVVDGADNNNTFFGQALGRTGSGRAPYQFSQDAVQEFQVNRNAYSAEFGRAGGAVINVVTKSGTNDVRGSLFWFYRDDALNENSFANKIAGRPISPYHYDQFGGSLGGPIQRDRAFYFLSYDGQRNDQPNDISIDLNLAGLSVPGDADTQAGLATLRAKGASYTRGQDQDVFLAKVDWNASPSHRLSTRYNHQDFTGTNFENGGPTNSSEHTGNSLVETRTLNSSLASVFSDRLFNEARLQYAKDDEPGQANSALPEATVRQGGRTILVVGRNNFSPRHTNIERQQLADTVTWIRGDHTLKGGVDVQRDEIENFFPGNFSGNYSFNSIASFHRGTPNGPGESYLQAFPGPGTTGPLTNPDIFEVSAFVQDEWEAREDLTFSFGLRYDLQEFEQPQVRNPDAQLAAAGIDTSFLNTDRDNFAPRLGVTWSPTADLVVRGGYGLFYGRTPAIMVGTAHSNNGINVQTISFTGAAAPTYPNVFTGIPTGGSAARPTIFVFDRDYEQPEVHQASLGAEYALGPRTALGIGYLYVRGEKLQRSRDRNLLAPVPTAIPVQGGGSVVVDQFPTTRPFANFNRIIQFESTAESEYHGLTLEGRRQFGRGLLATLAYTLGEVEDTVPDATAVVPGGSDDAKFASNPFDFEDDRAAGNNDQRHRLVLSGVWHLPFGEGAEGGRRALLDGWSLSWIAVAQSGQPYSRAVTGDLNRDGNSRNDIVPGSRNSERLPDAYTLDLRVAKSVPFFGDAALELIAEAFNVFDRDNVIQERNVFYNFTGGVLVPQATFGQQTLAADNRIVQLAAKITF